LMVKRFTALSFAAINHFCTSVPTAMCAGNGLDVASVGACSAGISTLFCHLW
jgi:hypothetical protein